MDESVVGKSVAGVSVSISDSVVASNSAMVVVIIISIKIIENSGGMSYLLGLIKKCGS